MVPFNQAAWSFEVVGTFYVIAGEEYALKVESCTWWQVLEIWYGDRYG